MLDGTFPAGDGALDRGISLAGLLPGGRFIACDDMLLRRCQDAPARIRPGDLFVARLTPRGDGHDEVAQAIARGAVGVVAERIVPTHGVPLCLVPDSGWAWGRLHHALAGDPARRLDVIAIAGTNGKTTAAWLTAAVLAEAGRSVGVLSDIGCIDGSSIDAAAEPYERAADLAAWFGRLVTTGCRHAVVEVSARAIAEQALAGVTCATVAVPSLACDDARSAAVIHDLLRPDGCLAVALDSPSGRRLATRVRRRLPAAVVIGTGTAAGHDVGAVPVDRSLFGQTFLLRTRDEVVPVAVDTPTACFVRDALVAAAVGLHHDLPLEVIARGLEAAGSVSGRVERIDHGQDAAVFVDTPSSGHAVAATLGSLRRLTSGRLVVLVEQRLAERMGGARFASRLGRWCDACLVVPPTLLDDDPGPGDRAAYRRVDRLLAGLGRGDCAVVLGTPRPRRPAATRFALGQVVSGWLRVAHPPRWSGGRAA